MYELDHLSDDAVQVHRDMRSLALAHHASNTADDLPSPAGIHYNSVQKAVESWQIGPSFGDETAARTRIVHNPRQRLVQLMSERSRHFCDEFDPPEMREFF